MSFLNPNSLVLPTQLLPVVPADAVRFDPSIVTVYGAGIVVLVDSSGVVSTLTGVPAGAQLPCMCTGILATGTTATNMVRTF